MRPEPPIGLRSAVGSKADRMFKSGGGGVFDQLRHRVLGDTTFLPARADTMLQAYVPGGKQ